jgi:signal transduction histidine kinase
MGATGLQTTKAPYLTQTQISGFPACVRQAADTVRDDKAWLSFGVPPARRRPARRAGARPRPRRTGPAHRVVQHHGRGGATQRGTPAWTRADPDRLRQVLGNLLSNAIRYTDQGGHVLLKVLAEQNEAILTVQDTGVGIAPGDLPRVFDRFWRADPARQRTTGGTGLGLTIAHRIVTDHGGRIDVTSRPHIGTTFAVHLPLDADQ